MNEAWLSPELTATPAACARIEAWRDAGSPVITPDELSRGLLYEGDPQIRAIVEGVLLKVPAPVAWHALRSTWFFGVGWASCGWHACAAPPLPPGGRHPRVVMIGGLQRDHAFVEANTAHEIAHDFLRTDASVKIAEQTSSERRASLAAFTAYAAAQDNMDAWASARELDELQACALAARWGFSGDATDGAFQAAAARQKVLEDAA